MLLKLDRLVFLTASLSLLAGCGSNSGGASGTPADGTWKPGSATCNGATTAFSWTSLTLAGASGSLVTTVSSCAITAPYSVSYPSTTTLVLTPSGGTFTCSPASCSGICGSSNTGTATTLNYSVSGSTLTLSDTASSAQNIAGCSSGQTELVTLTKQ